MKSSSYLLAAVMAAPSVFAADLIEPVVVSATRSERSAVTTPASITLITREQIAASGAEHLSQVLASQAGLQVSDLYGDGSRTSVSMRGFSPSVGGSSTLVLVDGRRLNNSDLSGPDLNSLPLQNVERVEIIHGSAGSLFGDQAVGGVINIITRTPQGSAARVETAAGTHQQRALRASAGDRLDNGLAWRVSGERRHSDNYREHNAQEFGNASARLDYAWRDSQVFAEVEYGEEKLQLPGALSDVQLADDRQQADPFNPNDANDSTGRAGRLGLRQALTANWQLEAELTARQGKVDGVLWGNAFRQERRHTGLTPRVVGSLPLQHGDAIVTLGADVEQIDYRIAGTFSRRDDARRQQALYAQGLVPVASSVVVTVGARHARLEDDLTDSNAFPGGIRLDERVSVGELGVSWQALPGWRLFARRDGNYRFALVDENTFTSPGVVGLDPQTGVSWELGSEWRAEHWRARTVLYRLDLDNEIAFDAAAPGPWGPGANVNLDPTRRTGAMIEGNVTLSTALALSGQIAYVNPTMEGGPNAGQAIPFVASRSARLGADWRFAERWNLYGEWQHVGSRYQDADFANALPTLPAVDLVNLNLGWREGSWSANARVNNVAGKEYVAFATYNAYYPAPERTMLITLGYDF